MIGTNVIQRIAREISQDVKQAEVLRNGKM
jgi:hypothetical protein